MWARIGILILIIILLYYFVQRTRDYISSTAADYEKYMYGMWVGGESFCNDADITNMMLFVGERKKGKRTAYLIIGPDVYNDIVTIKCPRENKKFKATLEFVDTTPMPTELTIDLDIILGQMRLYSGDTLYGVLYKNHEVTNETPEV